MRELRQHAEPALKILCLLLAALVVYELAGVALRLNPFHGVTVPELPALSSATNGAPSVLGAVASLPPGRTNLALTNGASPSLLHTNLAAGTNALSGQTNPVALTAGTNALSARTNFTSATNLVSATNLPPVSTNHSLVAAGNAPPMPGPMRRPGGAGMNPFSPPGKPGGNLPAAVQTRISRIVDSEILGPIMHPLPMALLGIAGQFAFLRSDSGQTGLVKEGNSLADLKLLRIGINRVLVEQNGQKKELMIFSGYGGDSLIQNDSTNENTHP